MKIKNIKTAYRRTLPHLQPVGAAFFVTFRLHGSIPNNKLLQLKNRYKQSIAALLNDGKPLTYERIAEERERQFAEYDALLDQSIFGPFYLQQPEIAQIIADELHRQDGKLYELIAYCIMPNHVHLLLHTHAQIPENFDVREWENLDFEPLDRIMKQVKGASARYCNQSLGRDGKFWQRESYDHYVRNPVEFGNILAYILSNPVKAGWVENWEDFPFTFLKEADYP